MTKEMKTGNVKVIYDEAMWSKEKSNKKSVVNTVSCIAIVLVMFIGVMFACYKVFDGFNPAPQFNTGLQVLVIVGSLVVCVFVMIVSVIVLSRTIYGNLYGLYMLLDYWPKTMEAGWFNEKILINTNDGQMTLNGIRKRAQCSEENFFTLYTKEERTGPIEIEVDTTKYPVITVLVK